jgi:putative peptide zinc metalloprotease protein
VRLAGQYQESAYTDPPWLIERGDAGYVHITPLIYRVAELCTGENTYDDIARKLTEAGTPVQPQTIQRLVGQLLIPRGLVVAADGSVAQTSAAGRGLTRINIRTREIRPETIERFTRILRWFYWPPVAAIVLLAAAAAEGWLYFVHGIAGGLRDALNYPGLTLVIMLFVIVAAAFHELGHAAAMHYAGSSVNGMGAGVYMVYPVFYTDVTNNYRLGRWPRLRTDLGGFYFNLIFVVAVMGAYALTRQEFLLLVVLLINFEIIHQLLPFLRLDGYWALADATGVPDFLTQMAAFVRRIVPGLRGQKMPELKWWGKAIFASYILISLPLMGFLLFVLVRAAPRAFATAYQSALNQAHGYALAQAHGDILGMVSAVGQILLLAIPTLGLAYTLTLLLIKLSRGIWRWSAPSWPRRAAGGALSVGIAALLVWLWMPARPSSASPRPQAGPAYAAASSDFRPIGQQDQGTVPEAVAALPWDASTTNAVGAGVTTAPSAVAPASVAAVPSSVPTSSAAPQPSGNAVPQPDSSVPAPSAVPATACVAGAAGCAAAPLPTATAAGAVLVAPAPTGTAAAASGAPAATGTTSPAPTATP